MSWQALAEDRVPRRGVDGRFAFGVAILLSGTGLLVLMDRIGVPDGLVRACAVMFVIAGLVSIAALLRTMRVSSFYVAGRAIPAPYAGLATASLGMGLFLPFLPPVPAELPLSGMFAGFACGMALTCLITGPVLRKTNALSLPDLIAARFPQLSARLGSILLTAAVSILIGLAGFAEALTTLQSLSGLGRAAAAALIAIVLLVCLLPGGLASTLWVTTTSAVVALAAFGLPLVIAFVQGTPLALPIVGPPELFRSALDHLEIWTGSAPTFHSMNLFLVAAIALGIGVLAPLLSPAMACRNRLGAQRAGFAGLFWGGLLILLTLATLLQASFSFDQAVIGKTPENLPPAIYQASTNGQLLICGAETTDRLTALSACAAHPGFSNHLTPADMQATSHYFLEHFADVGGYGAAFAGLASAAILAFGLVLAAAGIQAAANVLGNDMFYRVRDRSALTSRRLAITRAFSLALVGASAVLFSGFEPPARMLIALAVLLSAATLAPVLMLTLWRRATSIDATVALLVGLLTVEILIEFDPNPANFKNFAFNTLCACSLAFLAGMTTSLFRAGSSKDGDAFLRGIMSDKEEWLHPDKGV